MLGFEVGFWDYVTLVVAIVAAGLVAAAGIWVAGLPGQIAIARKHPDAEAVKIMGYAGFLPVVPWMQAFIWAFKPTDIVDIRRFPKEEREAIDADIRRLKGDDQPAQSTPAAAAPAGAPVAQPAPGTAKTGESPADQPTAPAASANKTTRADGGPGVGSGEDR